MIRFSCPPPPNAEVVELGCFAEQLGYRRGRCYDLIDKLAVDGITEVVLQPGGSDIRGELTRMAAAADLQANVRGVAAASAR